MPTFYGQEILSPLMLGTAQYPSPHILEQAFFRSKAGVATVSLRRENAGGSPFWDIIKNLNVSILPNTAGCYSVHEAVTTAHMARELFATDWIKLEVIGHPDTLQPDPFGLLEDSFSKVVIQLFLSQCYLFIYLYYFVYHSEIYIYVLIMA